MKHEEYVKMYAGHQTPERNSRDLELLVNGDWDFLMSCDVKQEVRPGASLALTALEKERDRWERDWHNLHWACALFEGKYSALQADLAEHKRVLGELVDSWDEYLEELCQEDRAEVEPVVAQARKLVSVTSGQGDMADEGCGE